MLPHTALLFQGEGRAFSQDDDRNSVLIQLSFRNHYKVAHGLGDTELMQGLHCNRDDAQGFPRLLEFPTGDGNHPIRLEMLEIFPESFHGIEAVLA